MNGGSDFTSGFTDDRLDSVTVGFTDENICGEGASCMVYRMRINGLQVAVKRLHMEYRTNPKYIASYRKEFQLGQRLKHDALPIYRELRVDANEVYIVMDFIDGVSLKDFIETADGKRYFRNAENVRRFFGELLNVTGYLHRSGVIHCDLKPANIIMRNSDRAVMLIDLDKAYSDALDRTHGGTHFISDPTSNKPIALKDYAAIGRIFDIIADAVPNIQRARFKLFRRECDNPDATAESLLKTLLPKSLKLHWIIAACLVIAVVFVTIFANKHNESSSNQTVNPAERDTIVTVIKQEPEPAALTPKVASLTINFDTDMAEFINSVQAELTRMSDGTRSDAEIQNLSMQTVEDYTSAYNLVVNAYKEKYPDMSGIDIEMAVARKAESSRAAHLMKKLTQAAADTLKRRHPDLYDDFE